MSFRRVRLPIVAFLLLLFFASASLLGAGFEILPASAPHGARAIITGTGLDDPSITVSFAGGGGTLPATIVSTAPTSIEMIVPPAATSGPVTVRSGSGTLATVAFTVLPDPPFITVVTKAASDKAHNVLKQPAGVAIVASGFLYAADTMHHQIVAVAPTGQLAVIAGTGKPGVIDGVANQAQFKEPGAVAVDAVRGVIYIADTGNNVIRKLTFDGVVTTFAGSGRGESGDGNGNSASFKAPSGIAVDTAGNVYVADTGNDQIRKITPAGIVTTIGGGTHGGFADGSAAQSLFAQPRGVACNGSGAVFVADSGNNRIRKIENGTVITLAGTGHGGFSDGSGAVAEFKNPSGIAIDDGGNVYVADADNNAVRKITSGNVVTISGTGKGKYTDGAVATAEFNSPLGIAIEGAIYVADSKNDALRVIYPAVTFAATTPNQGAASGGTLIRILGSGFVPGATQVTIGGTPVADSAMTYVSSTELLVTTPPHDVSGLVDVVVTTPAGSSTGRNAYTYGLPAPSIGSLSKPKGRTSGGETVTLTGSNFVVGQTTVRLGAADATQVVVTSATSLSFVTPPGNPGPAAISVTTPGGTATQAAAFQYMAAPVILSFTPTHGAAGTVVTITGQNFDPDPSGDVVAVAGTLASVTAATTSQLMILVPSGTLSGPIALTTAGGVATSAVDYTTAVTASPLDISTPFATLIVGARLSLAATLHATDGSTTDLTASAAWSSSNAAVATVLSGSLSALAAGTVSITATFGGNTASRTITILAPHVPVLLAPPLDLTVGTEIASATRFLYTGPNPVQAGVAPQTMSDLRVTLLRGVVRSAQNTPLPGVAVSVLNHIEFGQTWSRADGSYDLVVNGGAPLTLRFEMPGFLPVDRGVQTAWREFNNVPDVVLLPIDNAVTTVSLNSPSYQAARGSAVTDSDGTRQATVITPPGMTASITLPNGTSQPLSSLHLRMTEYTVGSGGAAAMPASLPPQSAYTYCVEISADEAMSAGATRLDFSKPASVYVNNFLHFRVGTAIPLGTYDRVRGTWIAAEDGKVISVVSISGGLADIDFTGDGVADDPAGIDMDDGERRQVAQLFSTGDSLWRARITHLSPWDSNCPAYGPADAVPPAVDPAIVTIVDHPACQYGSVIECENQVVQEHLPIAGTPFDLTYRSANTAARQKAHIHIPLTGESIPQSLEKVLLEISVSGRKTALEFSPAARASYDFIWDSRDSYGRTVNGPQGITIRIGYQYPAEYGEPQRFTKTFGDYPTTRLPVGTRGSIVLWQDIKRTFRVGAFDAAGLGFGGWTLSAQHSLFPDAAQVLFGDGRQLTALKLAPQLTTVAGGSEINNILDPVRDIATTGEGTILVLQDTQSSSGQFTSSIAKVGPNGIRTNYVNAARVAGFGGDGGPAVNAAISRSRGIAVGPDGSLYIADTGNLRVRRVDPNGIITTVAGNGRNSAFFQNGEAATQTGLSPSSVYAARDGSVYIGGFAYLMRLKTDGTLHAIAGTGQQASSDAPPPSPAPGLEVPLQEVRAITGDEQGNLYFIDRCLVLKVDTSGILTTVAGRNDCDTTGDGGPAIDAFLYNPHSIVTLDHGDLLVSDRYTLRKIAANGTISRFGGNGTATFFAGTTDLYGVTFSQASLAVTPKGTLLTGVGSIVQEISSPLPSFRAEDYYVPEQDGSLIHRFTSAGKHVESLHTQTLASAYTLQYGPDGLLSGITDEFGQHTSIVRSGASITITSPGGSTTQLAIDGSGYLRTVTSPGGRVTAMNYEVGGLLSSIRSPEGVTTTMSYDGSGLLTNHTDPFHTRTLTRTELTGGVWQIALQSSSQRLWRYFRDERDTGTRLSTITQADATVTTTEVTAAGAARSTTYPDGTAITSTLAGDPRFLMLTPITSSVVRVGDKTLEVANTRDVFMNATDPRMTDIQSERLTINGKTYLSVFKTRPNVIDVTTPMGRRTHALFNAHEQLTELDSPAVVPLAITYDSQGRAAAMTQGNRTIRLGHDGDGRLVTIAAPLAPLTTYERDADGRVTGVANSDGRRLDIGYNADGNVLSLTTPTRALHRFSYSSGRLAHYSSPLGQTTDWSYDADGNIVGIAHANGTSTSMTFDSGNHLADITGDSVSLHFDYDAQKRVARGIANGSETTTYAWSGPLVTSQTWSGPVTGTIGYEYDDNLRIASENGFARAYDDDGKIILAGALSLSRDPASGRVIGTSLGNLTDSYSYDQYGDAASYQAAYAGNTFFGVSITRDGAGRISQRAETYFGATTTDGYTYDSAGRLASVSRNGTTVSTYTYDANGNRLSQTTPSGAVAGSYDADDRLQSYGAVTYTYGGDGALRSKQGPDGLTSYTYDALGNLRTVVLPTGRTVEYVLDAQNRRIGKKVDGTLVRGWLYGDQLRIVAELDGGGNIVSQFVYGSRRNIPDYVVKAGATYRIIADHLGSPRIAVDVNTGLVAWNNAYDEFGNPVPGMPDFLPFGFAGGQYDADTGLVRFGVRDYEPQTGRWTARDPILFAGADANLYAYASNDPVNAIDPTGLVGFGVTLSEATEAGLVRPALAQTGTLGLGIFTEQGDGEFGAFGSWGGMNTMNPYGPVRAYPPNCNAAALGGFAGGGLGGFITNATTVHDLDGPFHTASLNFGWGIRVTSLQFSWGRNAAGDFIGVLNVGLPGVGVGFGGSVSYYDTNTVSGALPVR